MLDSFESNFLFTYFAGSGTVVLTHMCLVLFDFEYALGYTKPHTGHTNLIISKPKRHSRAFCVYELVEKIIEGKYSTTNMLKCTLFRW